MTAVLSAKDKSVFLFGGQDSERDDQFDELWVFSENSLQQVEFKLDDPVPAKRNSHTMVATDKCAYIFGGANQDGPLNDLWELDFETRKFKKIKLTGVALPAVEMHTSHIYKNKYMLIIGGRALPQGAKLEEIQFSDIIYQIDLESGEVSEFGKLPSAIGSHISAVVDEKYLVLYGGTNGFRFFDSILRYSIEEKKWTLMTRQPQILQGSSFLQDGRIASSAC